MYSVIFECVYSSYNKDKHILYVLHDFVKHHQETVYENKHNLHHNLVQDAKRAKLFSTIRHSLEKVTLAFRITLVDTHIVTPDQLVDDIKDIYIIKNGIKLFNKKDLCEIDRNGLLIKG